MLHTGYRTTPEKRSSNRGRSDQSRFAHRILQILNPANRRGDWSGICQTGASLCNVHLVHDSLHPDGYPDSSTIACGLSRFDEDATHSKELVNRCQPKLRCQIEPRFAAERSKFSPTEGSTLPRLAER